MLIDDGILRRVEGGGRSPATSRTSIPPTINALLTARLERLTRGTGRDRARLDRRARVLVERLSLLSPTEMGPSVILSSSR